MHEISRGVRGQSQGPDGVLSVRFCRWDPEPSRLKTVTVAQHPSVDVAWGQNLDHNSLTPTLHPEGLGEVVHVSLEEKNKITKI